MEDNVKPRPLTEDELQKVAGGIGLGISEAECKKKCEALHAKPVMNKGFCTCQLNPESKKV